MHKSKTIKPTKPITVGFLEKSLADHRSQIKDLRISLILVEGNETSEQVLNSAIFALEHNIREITEMEVVE